MGRPKGSRKSVPSYCLHKRSGKAYVTIGGQEKYLGTYDSPESHVAYDRLVAEWLASGRTTPAAPAKSDAPPSVTVTMLLGAFWEHAQTAYPAPPFAPGKRPAGELGNYYDVIKVLRPLYGTTSAAEFGPRRLRALAETMIGLKWSRNYINRSLSRVKAIFKFGVAHELIEPSVHHKLAAVDGLKRGRSAARETDPIKPVAEHALDATLPYLSRHVRAMVEFQLLTGARPGEVCGLRTRDMDTSGAIWLAKLSEHKTAHHGHEREIRIGPKAQAVLRPFLKTDLAAFIFSPAAAEAERLADQHARRTTPIGQGNRPGTNRKRRRARAPGERYDVDSFRRAIARACDRADEWGKGGAIISNDERFIPRWHPHQLRHNAATRLRRDYGVDAANIILGHTTLRATQIYAEADGAKASKIMAEVG
jgi:integrase